MSNEFKFRDLTKDDIEVRVQSCGVTRNGTNYVKLLLYKDARCDMNILDEVVGVANWQRKHYECKGTLFCEIGIKIDNEWIWKSDAGVPSNAEAVKGEASDSFKRAGFNWGIGRELYTAPDISIFNNCLDLEQKGKGYKCNSTFEVTHFVVKNKKITELKIAVDGTEIFIYPKQKNTYNKPKQATQTQQVTNEELKELEKHRTAFDKYLTSIKTDRKWVEKTFDMRKSIESLNLTEFVKMEKTVKEFVESEKKKAEAKKLKK